MKAISKVTIEGEFSGRVIPFTFILLCPRPLYLLL
jgi:hypothetical protein